MICRAEEAYELMDGRAEWTARPIFRRNGQPMGYRVGGVYAVQPGRFQPHIGHIEIMNLEPSTAGALRATDEWELPDAWADNLELAVMRVRPGASCLSCRTLEPGELC